MMLAQETDDSTHERALRRTVKSLVRLAFRLSISAPKLIELIKGCYVEVAQEELFPAQKKTNTSRISVATGLSRQEIMRVERAEDPAPRSASLRAKVLGQWEGNKRFSSHLGPRPLTYEGADSEFAELVQSVSTNVHPSSVLHELLRSGAIEKKGSKVAFIRGVNRLIKETSRGLDLLGRGIESQILAAKENVESTGPESPNLYSHTTYDNIRPQFLDEIRAWFKTEGRAFHKRAREFLSAFDKDINPEVTDVPGEGAKVELLSFSLITHKDDNS